jgi:hypothetical protein
MSNLLNLSTATPTQVDEAWAEAMAPAYLISARLSEARTSLRRYQKYNQTPDYLVERVEKLEAQLAEARKAGAPFDAEYERRGGWSRYLLVANADGHVHRAPGGCHTVRPFQTLVQPVYALSGSTVAEVIDTLGTTACTVCFPSAPVETRESRQRRSAEAAAVKAAERETKRREKLAKAAIRAQKLLAKVEAAYEALGGQDAVLALPRTGPGSAYGLTIDLPTQVGDCILDDVKESHGERRYNRDPREVIAEARELALV